MNNNRKGDLFIKRHPKSPVSEAYRFIRTNLNYMNPDNPLKVIGITSTTEQEGKSTVSANLGKALSLDLDNVIIVDADLRKPMLNRFFGIIGEKGLSDYLSQDINYKEIIKKTGEENLDIITTGNVPPNPAELLGSKKMKKLFNILRSKYDKVIVDTPPVMPVSDPVLLAPMMDGIILVVAAKETPIELLKKSKKMLDNVNANVLGTILNKYPADTKGKYAKNYYY